jgi:hypothetical protein
MAKQLSLPDFSVPDLSVLSNPMAWADFSMRALEMTLSSSQDIGERMERLARAGASEEATEAVVHATAAPSRSPAEAASRVALASDLQRSTFDLMSQGWVQWMSMLGSFASMAAGLMFPPGGAQRLGLNPLALLPAGGAAARDALFAFGGSSRSQTGQQRESRAERTSSAEHAHASAEPKRRRTTSRTKSKPRRSRRA